MKNIPTRVGLEVPLIIIIILGFSLKDSFDKNHLIPIFASLIIFLIVIFILFSIKYSIDGNYLIIKNGIFGTSKINILEIKKIEKTYNLISSPAPSIFGRVEIYFGKESLVISPKNFEKFKKELLNINSNITVKE